MIQNHQVELKFSAPFHTLSELGPETEHVWLICHGYAQLSRRFAMNFDHLDPYKHFIISLQGLSRFYLPGQRHVGASWMTREDRAIDLDNQKGYFEAIYDTFNQGQDWDGKKLHLLGFSQGASAIARLAAHLKLDFDHLILWAGSWPPELGFEDFGYLSGHQKTIAVLADQDEYFSAEHFATEQEKMDLALDISSELITYEGKHQLDREVISQLVRRF